MGQDTDKIIEDETTKGIVSFGIIRDYSYENELRWELWRFLDGEKEGLISVFYEYGRAELMARRYNKGYCFPNDVHILEEDHFWVTTDVPGYYKCDCGKYSVWDRERHERKILSYIN